MPFQKGRKKTGGKLKGYRKNRTIEEVAERIGCDPFEVLCLFAAGDKESLGVPKVTARMRFAAAKEACKYTDAQKKSVEITNPDGTGFKIEIVDYSSDRPKDKPST